MNEIEISKNELLRQFETKIGGELATIEYVEQERKIFLTKVSIPSGQDLNGFQDQFIEEVLRHLSNGRTRLVPTCDKVVKFMRKNSGYQKLLPPGVLI